MALISTFNMSRVYEIQKCREDGETLGPESWKLLYLILVLIHKVIYELELELPSDHLGVQVQHLINKLTSLWTAPAGVGSRHFVVCLGSRWNICSKNRLTILRSWRTVSYWRLPLWVHLRLPTHLVEPLIFNYYCFTTFEKIG